MSEGNKQEEKVKVKIQGKEFELTKTEDNKYSGKISLNINGIENEVSGEFYLSFFDNTNVVDKITFYHKKQKISFKIGDIKNENVEVYEIEFHNNNSIKTIYFNHLKAQKISFKIGDILNSNIEVVDELTFYENGNIETIYFKGSQQISFKLKDIINANINVVYISLSKSGYITEIIPSDKITKINCCINDKKYTLCLSTIFFMGINTTIPESHIRFFEDGTLKGALLGEDINLNVRFHGKDYDLPFKNGEYIFFNKNKELSQGCIDNSPERSAIVYAERLNELEKTQKELKARQKIATLGDWLFVLIAGFIGLYCVAFALGLCFGKVILPFNYILPDNFNQMSFDYHLHFLNQEHETFNRYTFFYEILKRTPIFILFILGFKFLQLAFERLRLIGKVEQVRNYIALTADDNTKKDLLKTIAIPFFAPKKVKSSFFERLIDKVNLNVKYDTNDKQETKTNSDK